MKRKAHNFRGHGAGRGASGFTLLEIIVTILIAAIMGVFFVQFVGTAVIHSADPVRRIQNMSSATECMEKMTTHYKQLAATQSNFLAILKDFVQFGNEMTHPEERAGYPYYGSYEILCNKYVRFNSSRVEEDDPDQVTGRTLKVTIRRGDQTVTSLFTR